MFRVVYVWVAVTPSEADKRLAVGDAEGRAQGSMLAFQWSCRWGCCGRRPRRQYRSGSVIIKEGVRAPESDARCLAAEAT